MDFRLYQRRRTHFNVATPTQVVIEARSWIGTPYHRRAAIKGAGVDCGMLPYAVLRKFDLIPEFDIAYLSNDWFNNTTQEKYLLMVQRYLRRLVGGRVSRNFPALPGTLACVRVVGSRVFNHSGIVTQWPRVVHATWEGVREVNASVDPMWACMEIEIYDPWGYVQQEEAVSVR